MTPSSKPSRSVQSKKSKGSIRIIGGQHRGRKLPVLDAQGLRPTGDRNKETLFNWLMHDCADAKVLDMFAGSGALAFEALSRRANSITMIELDKVNARQLQENINTLKAQASAHVICEDAIKAVPALKSTYDIVFIDPPFGKELVKQAISALVSSKAIHDGTKVYVEMESMMSDELTTITGAFDLLKQKQSGQVFFALYAYRNTP